MTTCNVQNVEAADLLVPFEGGFSQYNAETLKVIKNAELDGDVVKIAPPEIPNSITSMWFLEKLRVGDGFRAEFNVEILDGTADGFAFIVQDDRTVNINGNGGGDIGFTDVFPRYLAVAFDFCADRSDCAEQNVRIETRQEDENGEVEDSVVVANATAANFFGENLPVTTKFRIDYLDDLARVDVLINDELVLSSDPGSVSLKTILADTNTSFFGFTASNPDSPTSNVNALDMSIQDLSIFQMKSGFKMAASSLVTKTVDFGAVVNFEFDLVDSCGVPLNEAALEEFAFTPEDVDAFMLDVLNENQQPFPPIAVSIEGSTVILAFQTVANVPTEYTVEVQVRGILVQDNPLDNIVVTVEPEARGLSTTGIALLIALIVVLVVVVLVIVRGWNNYRKKLAEHAEDIEYGITKANIDQIETTIDYQVNPMIAPLDKLKERLAKNEQVIADLKAGQQNAVDSDYTVEQLQQENEQLREEMKELKRQQEIEGVGGGMGQEKHGFEKNQRRFDFGEEGV